METLLVDNEWIVIHRKNGIMHLKWKITHLNMENAQKLVSYRIKAGEGATNYPIYTDISSLKNTTREARDYFAGEEACKGLSASAIKIDSFIGGLIGNFYLKVCKPIIPTKLFTDENEAKKWLVKYRV